MDQTSAILFIRAACDVFDTMLHLEIEPGAPAAKQPGSTTHDISGIVRFTGDVEGEVILGFPEATAHRACAIFAGVDCSENEEVLHDAIGELASIIAGSAKARFNDKNVSMSCPSVAIGADHIDHAQPNADCIRIPFNCDCGEFTVEFALKGLDTAIAAEPAAAASN